MPLLMMLLHIIPLFMLLYYNYKTIFNRSVEIY